MNERGKGTKEKQPSATQEPQQVPCAAATPAHHHPLDSDPRGPRGAAAPPVPRRSAPSAGGRCPPPPRRAVPRPGEFNRIRHTSTTRLLSPTRRGVGGGTCWSSGGWRGRRIATWSGASCVAQLDSPSPALSSFLTPAPENLSSYFAFPLSFQCVCVC